MYPGSLSVASSISKVVSFGKGRGPNGKKIKVAT